MSDWFWRLLGWRRVTLVVRSADIRRPFQRWAHGDVSIVCGADGCLESVACGVVFIRLSEEPATEQGEAVRTAWDGHGIEVREEQAGTRC